MESSLERPRSLRFGSFELDLEALELRKNGLKLRLQGQPLQVLRILLEHTGRVVTRQDLQSKLWPGTEVDFDHGLNNAMLKLREVLDDSATTPRFIETIARLGYRFLVPVEVIAQLGANGRNPDFAVPNGVAGGSEDGFLPAVKQLRQQFLSKRFHWELVELRIRTEHLLTRYPDHPEHHEAQFLLHQIKSVLADSRTQTWSRGSSMAPGSSKRLADGWTAISFRKYRPLPAMLLGLGYCSILILYVDTIWKLPLLPTAIFLVAVCSQLAGYFSLAISQETWQHRIVLAVVAALMLLHSLYIYLGGSTA
jgi:DNA-binding winged helix-turn-helix (wHTH) protein